MTKLQAGALRADSFPRTADGKNIAFPGGWTAPDDVRVPMRFERGLPLVACRVNGREVWMFLDTGSQRTVFEANTALRCGLRVVDPSVIRPKIEGSSGTESALAALPETMEIGGWRWKGLPCLVRTRENRADSNGRWTFDILGMDALHGMCSYVTLDYPQREAVFGFHKPFVAPPSGLSSFGTLEVQKNAPTVLVESGEKSWRAVLDTGASMPVVVDLLTAMELGWAGRFAASNRTIAGLGDPGPAGQTRLVHVTDTTLRCLGSQFKAADVLIVPDSSKIGSGLLQYFKTTLDFTRNRVWLEFPRGSARTQ